MSESLNFDRIAERYDATRGGEARGEQIGGDVAKLLRSDRAVLEVGVGTGVIAKALARRGFRVCGVDISSQMLERAKERIGPRVAQGDAQALPIGSDSIDQVVVVWVLHVVGDHSSALREFARVLRPDGRAFIVDGKATFDPDDPVDVAYRDLEVGLGRIPRLGRVHEWAELAPDVGLRVERIVDAGPYAVSAPLAGIASNIETRAHSWMWNVPDDEWERVSRPVLERLHALPTFDAPRMYHDYQEILVLTGSR